MASDIIPIQNLYYLLCYAWDVLPEANTISVDWEDAPNAVELFGKVLADGTRRLLLRGLKRDYVAERDCGSHIRGKILLTESVRGLSLKYARAHFEYDDLSLDNPENRVLRYTLGVLAFKVRDRKLKQRLSFLYRQLSIIPDIAPVSSVASAIHGRRLSPFYRFLMHICEFVLESLLPNEKGGEMLFRDFIRDERKMAQVFEKFVCNFYRREQSEYRVEGQTRIPWLGDGLDAVSQAHLPEMRPDIVLWRRDSAIVIETKFYREALLERYGKLTVRSAHLYQLMSYLTHLGTASSVGALLYPAKQTRLDFRYSLADRFVLVRSVDLTAQWTEIAETLLTVVGTCRRHSVMKLGCSADVRHFA